jgi:hypothetical protein
MNEILPTPSPRPKVIFWYHVYCIVTAVVALLLGVAGAALWTVETGFLGMNPREAREEGACVWRSAL